MESIEAFVAELIRSNFPDNQTANECLKSLGHSGMPGLRSFLQSQPQFGLEVREVIRTYAMDLVSSELRHLRDSKHRGEIGQRELMVATDRLRSILQEIGDDAISAITKIVNKRH